MVFSEVDDGVAVEEAGGEHNHEVVEEIVEGSNLRWTAQQTKVVMTGVLNEASPTVIRRNLKELFPEGKLPSAIQIANKIAHCQCNQASVDNRRSEEIDRGELGDRLQ